jgi:hypothetical protein
VKGKGGLFRFSIPGTFISGLNLPPGPAVVACGLGCFQLVCKTGEQPFQAAQGRAVPILRTPFEGRQTGLAAFSFFLRK